ncbi:TULIP family P47-like protein [Deinococcus sp. HMF7604]|uniref:TULIP family P47-like protein n=1 Tax=Deinococcus betulae TaxID=2873312 RepID=UPI001CCE429F|nr:TULIP family P47-like protein [Deinococcus betulae]MBZ9753460.1 TULIP family P47-like protein [Deinococcus betulae]
MLKIKNILKTESGTRIEFFNPNSRPKRHQKVAASQPFLTNNWDTVFSATYEQLNNFIINNMEKNRDQYPQDWQEDVLATKITAAVKAESGSFGAWLLASAGDLSGDRLTMTWNDISCNLTIGSDDAKMSYLIKGATAYVEVSLRAVEAEPKQESGNGQMFEYKVNPVATLQTPALSIMDIDLGDVSNIPADDIPDVLAGLTSVLESWGSKNLSAFQHVFNTFTLNGQGTDSSFNWIQPTETAYAYQRGSEPNSSFFAVLSMVNNRSSRNSLPSLQPGSIPLGYDTCFNISPDLMYANMILPSMTIAFKNANSDTFRVDNSQITLSAGQTFNLDDVSVAGSSYTPKVKNFHLKINGDQLEIYTYVCIHVSPGIDTYIETTAFYKYNLIEKNGKQYITYYEAQSPVENSWTDIADWVEITLALIDMIVAVIGVWIGAASATAANVSKTIIITIVAVGLVEAVMVVAEAIPEWMAGDVPDELPPLNDLIANTALKYTWSNDAEFTLKQASLNGTLQLSGSLVAN